MDEPISGNAIADGCENTHVVNELEIPVITLGINNAVIAATPDGILVSDKEASQKLKDYVEPARPIYEWRGRGEYKVLDYKCHEDDRNSLIKKLIISPGEHISYQKHNNKTEI